MSTVCVDFINKIHFNERMLIQIEMKGIVFVRLSEKCAEIAEMRKQNAKSVLKKIAIGVLSILMVGIIIYSLLFFVMVFM